MLNDNLIINPDPDKQYILCCIVRHLPVANLKRLSFKIDNADIKISKLKPFLPSHLGPVMEETCERPALRSGFLNNFKNLNTAASIEISIQGRDLKDGLNMAGQKILKLCALIRNSFGVPCLIEIIFLKDASGTIIAICYDQLITSYTGPSVALGEFKSINKISKKADDFINKDSGDFEEYAETIALATGSARNLMIAFRWIWTVCEDLSPKKDSEKVKKLSKCKYLVKYCDRRNNVPKDFARVFYMGRRCLLKFEKDIKKRKRLQRRLLEILWFFYKVRCCAIHEGKCGFISGIENDNVYCHQTTGPTDYCEAFFEKWKNQSGGKPSHWFVIMKLQALARIFLSEKFDVPYNKNSTWKELLS